MKIILFVSLLWCAISASANTEYDRQYRDWKQKQPAVPQARVTQATDKSSANAKISINQADQHAFAKMSGIGDKKAQAIVDYRTEHGPFKQVDELKKIKGIGDKILEKNKDRLVL